ncbi:MAG: hypothetical protein LKI53_09600 [Bacteroidales bacterium]|jgi:Ca2+/Na+ antiporter|nr:hypothetical protein [Bacteroidales bacterium]
MRRNLDLSPKLTSLIILITGVAIVLFTIHLPSKRIIFSVKVDNIINTIGIITGAFVASCGLVMLVLCIFSRDSYPRRNYRRAMSIINNREKEKYLANPRKFVIIKSMNTFLPITAIIILMNIFIYKNTKWLHPILFILIGWCLFFLYYKFKYKKRYE